MLESNPTADFHYKNKMRVLWFSMTPSLFNPFSNSHNGGGWVASLEQIVRGIPEIDLGVAFYFGSDHNVYEKEGVKYYTLPADSRGTVAKWLSPEKEEDRIKRYLEVINDFKPDIIQIFGSENDYGLICERTDVPVVIHIQGSMPPYHNALFPIGMNTSDFYLGRGLTMQRRIMGLRSEQAFRKRAEREIGIFKQCRNFMGRTDWDRNLVELFNPAARYYHCEEALRDSFISSGRSWQSPATDGKIKITSIISTPWYKGFDVILKTAKLLKEHGGVDFEWNVFGISDVRFFENKYQIMSDSVNVKVRGSVGKEQLVEELCSSTLYVHPSYIDNSPNSLCEAQYLGVPVIATNVGGISSLVRDNETGLLVPANDPYTLAGKIKALPADRPLMETLSRNERAAARTRHNPEAIGQTLVGIYRQILADTK